MQTVRNNQFKFIEDEKFLKKKVHIHTVLEIFNKKRFKDSEEFFEEIKRTIKPTKVKGRPHRDTVVEEKKYPVLDNYISHYVKQGFALSTLDIQIRTIKIFLSFLSKQYSDVSPFKTSNDMKSLTKPMIIAYEKHLEERLILGEIQKCTVNLYLNAVRAFVKMLSSESIISMVYIVPERLKASGKRSNEYIEVEKINAFIDTLVNSKSKTLCRDLCIVLLIMETGCRPIEIKNLKICDFKSSDRKIHLYSVKSGNRTLKISKDLCDLITQYLGIRSNSTNNEFLFINSYGEQLSNPKDVFCRINSKKTDGQKITAKALRHTYATNALDNGNDFDEVSESMGHKHRCSTEYYIHRSIKRLLNNTLSHNPLSQFQSEG